ncbi:MAG: hypothetical protein HQL82_16510 [Magnetococcales bacterium]|nr:hypothetical protein [Magnetococcales bacterium]
MAIAIALHLLCAVIWIGGMFFAILVLRPAAESLELDQRVTLWAGVLGRFFVWVWGAVLLLPVTGYWMVWRGFGGLDGVGLHVHIMQGLGWSMIGLFAWVFCGPFRHMRRMHRQLLIPEAGLYILRIRIVVILNLVLGLLLVLTAAAGRYW